MDYYLAQLAGYASGKPRFRIPEFLAPSSIDSAGGGMRPMSAQDAAKIVAAQYG